MAHNEVISNAIENIAFRRSEQRNGTISPAEVLPYLPVSIGMVIDVLNDAAAESAAINAETIDGIRRYTFQDISSAGDRPSGLAGVQCVTCDQEERVGGGPLCSRCSDELEGALKKEAETNAWPAQAVYEHEICYLATRMSSPISAEKLAASSRFTLRRMRRKLKLMQDALAVREERNGENDTLSYMFPEAPYSRDRFLENIRLIRTFPASVTEDVEVRIVHILVAIGILFFSLLILAVWAVPFPFLFILFLIAAPILATVIWKRRLKQDSLEVN